MFNPLKVVKTTSKLGVFKTGVVLLTLLLTACGSEVVVKTTLNNTRDVKEGADVYLEEKIVGEVTDVTHSGGNTVLTIELDEVAATEVKQNAAVVVNRLKAQSPIEIYNQKTAAEAVQNGQELKGLDSMFQLGAWMVGDSLDLGADSLAGYVDAFQKYLKGDGWQQDKQVISEQAKQAADAAEGAVKQAAKEMEKITTELGKVEGEVASAVEQMGNDLAPVFGELAKSGQSIVQELEKFTQNLEQKEGEEKAVGTDFIQSLEKALETLNKSIEQGISEPNLPNEPELNKTLPEHPTQPAVNDTESAVEQLEKMADKSIEASEKVVEDLIQEANDIKTGAVESEAVIEKLPVEEGRQ